MTKTFPDKAFILGNPRSGTSLLRIMLNANPHIIAAPESGFMQWWYDKYKTWSKDDSENRTIVKNVVNDFLSSKKIESWEINSSDLISMIENNKPENYGDLCSLVFIQRAQLINKTPKVVIDKNNYYIKHLDTIEKIWPDAKYIYLIRDGRDVACSYLAMKELESNSKYRPDLPGDLEEIAIEWKNNNLRISDHLSMNHKCEHLTVKYEDLLISTETTLREITHFLGLPFDDAMLNYFEHNDEPQSTIDWKKNTKVPIMTDNVGKYKSHLSSEQIDIFNHLAGDVLKHFDYET